MSFHLRRTGQVDHLSCKPLSVAGPDNRYELENVHGWLGSRQNQVFLFPFAFSARVVLDAGGALVAGRPAAVSIFARIFAFRSLLE